MTHEVRIGADYMCTRRALTTGHRACLSSVRTRLKLSMADQSTPSERLPVGPATPQKDAPPDAETKKSKKKARGRLNDSPDTQLSKTLSYMLRHGAAKESLNIRADGFVKMDDLLARPKLKGVTLEDVERIVNENAKQRFAIMREPIPESSSSESTIYIRANQGHSIQVPELELVPLTRPEDLPTVVHGTYEKVWPLILLEGLKPMKRTHIHFASGLLHQPEVISGMRASRDIDIYLDVPKCLSAGILFYRSQNGVILTQGLPDSNSIPTIYFKKAVHKSGKILYPADELADPVDVN